MIPDETVERVREAADIVEIIGEHVKLRRTGNDYRGACPFHHGKNPNFAVSPRKGIYHCYKCGVSGDVFSFLREHVGLSFVDAVKAIGERYGVEVIERSGGAGRREERDEREGYWEVLAAAAEYYQETLWSADDVAAAREYLASRQIDRVVADRFGMGFAPRDGSGMRQRLEKLGFGDDRLLAAGLLVQREDEEQPRPRFRQRLMFPIADAAGHPAGFGGRVIGAGEPKYLNSPETAVFVKGRLLYHLDQAKQSIRKADRVLLVEGYFDVVRLAVAGLEETVAPLGTALAEGQAALLARFTRNALLLYDSDEAGLKATFRSGLELLRHGMSVRVVTLPAGEDPDTYVARHGGERLERHLGAAVDLFERQIQILERAGWFGDLHRKRRAVDRLLPTIRAAADPLTRDLYLSRLAEVTGLERATLQREAEEEPRGSHSRGRSTTGGAGVMDAPPYPSRGSRADLPPAPTAWPAPRRRSGFDRRHWDRRGTPAELVDSSRPKPGSAPTRGAERSLVLAMLHQQGYVEIVASRIQPESFRDPIMGEIFSVLVAIGDARDVEAIAAELSTDATAALQELLGAGEELVAPRQMVEDSLAKLRYFELTEQIEALDRELARAVGERRHALEQERHRIAEERRTLGARVNWARRLGT